MSSACSWVVPDKGPLNGCVCVYVCCVCVVCVRACVRVCVCVLYVLDGMVAGLGGHSHVQKVGHAPYDRCNNPQLQRESY